MIELTVLGSGTAVPSARRNSPGYLLRFHGSVVLMDLGSGTVRQLARAGVGVDRVDTILVSHLHPDHVADLAAFAWACRALPAGRGSPLGLIGPAGMAAHWRALQEAHAPHLSRLRFPVEVRERTEGRIDLAGARLEVRPMAHSAPTIGFRIEDADGARLAYTADTDECENLVRLVAGVGLWIADCSTPDEAALPGHLSPARVARVARAARPGRVLVSHLYPAWEDRDPAAEVRRLWEGAVETAEDLQSWRVEAVP